MACRFMQVLFGNPRLSLSTISEELSYLRNYLAIICSKDLTGERSDRRSIRKAKDLIGEGSYSKRKHCKEKNFLRQLSE